MKRISIIIMIIILTWTATVQGAPNPQEANIDIEGYLMEIQPPGEGPAMVIIEGYAGNRYQLNLNEATQLFIDALPVALTDLRPGLEVLAAASDGILVSLDAFSTPEPAYILPGSRTIQGLVTQIDRDQIRVRGDNGVDERYAMAPFTIATRNGQSVPLDSLYAGDRVILYFDELDSYVISRMEIEGKSVLVSNLYRGKVQSLNPLIGNLAVGDVEVFKNGDWQAHQALMTVPYQDEVPVYISGSLVPESKLKYYRGKTVYLLARSIMGRETVDRMIVKNESEYSYTGKIAAINWYANEFELSNNLNFYIGDGSIVMRDGRLQDKTALTDQANALILADAWGGRRTANIVYILDDTINPSNFGQRGLIVGQLDLITDDSLWVKDYYTLQDNAWEEVNEEKQLFYDSDCKIYDIESEEWIDPRALVAGDYSVDEDSDYTEDNDLTDWYGYIYIDGDRAIAMTVQPELDSLLSQRVTSGQVAGISEDSLVGWTIDLSDARDWSSYKEQWMPKNSNLKVNVENVLVIKNGQAVTPDRLQTGDRLYLVRDDYNAKFIMVK